MLNGLNQIQSQQKQKFGILSLSIFTLEQMQAYLPLFVQIPRYWNWQRSQNAGATMTLKYARKNYRWRWYLMVKVGNCMVVLSIGEILFSPATKENFSMHPTGHLGNEAGKGKKCWMGMTVIKMETLEAIDTILLKNKQNKRDGLRLVMAPTQWSHSMIENIDGSC